MRCGDLHVLTQNPKLPLGAIDGPLRWSYGDIATRNVRNLECISNGAAMIRSSVGAAYR